VVVGSTRFVLSTAVCGVVVVVFRWVVGRVIVVMVLVVMLVVVLVLSMRVSVRVGRRQLHFLDLDRRPR
jgi:hypothetical protein